MIADDVRSWDMIRLLSVPPLGDRIYRLEGQQSHIQETEPDTFGVSLRLVLRAVRTNSSLLAKAISLS